MISSRLKFDWFDLLIKSLKKNAYRFIRVARTSTGLTLLHDHPSSGYPWTRVGKTRRLRLVFVREAFRSGRYHQTSAIWYNLDKPDGRETQQQIDQVHALLESALFLWDWPDWWVLFDCLSHFSNPLPGLRPSTDIRYPLCSYCGSIFLNR